VTRPVGRAVESPPISSARATRTTVANRVWATAVGIRNRLKRRGLLGPLDELSAYWGPRLLPPPAGDSQVSLPFDLSFVVPARSPSFRNFATGLYEADVTQTVFSQLAKGMTFVDLGASIGYYTLLASRLVGTTGHVFAFEPDPETYAYLKKNVSRNQCTNVETVRKIRWRASSDPNSKGGSFRVRRPDQYPWKV
jgi:hypothetical protein